MPCKRKKNVVTMQKKLEAVYRLDKGETLNNIAKDYGVGTSTVGDWEKNRAHIENFCAKMVTKDSLGEWSTARKAKK